ncbi:MAG: hypothetical protein IRY97_09500 [Thermomicrobiaceae bacterium]|nr:hypothetical protein [Thermomicrobiaceae bacterium]
MVLALGGLLLPLGALAAVTLSRAELDGTRLRLEGQASPNRTITVNGVAMGASDASGRFKIERDPFAAPADCTVAVDDGSSTPATARLSGCTASSPSASSPSLSTVTVSPTDVVGGDVATGTVTLTGAAPAEGVTVTLSSDNTAAATVPPSVVVPAGATRATFTVTTNAVSTSQSAVLIGTAGGVTAHAVLTVWTAFQFANGGIAIVPGGNGSGRVTSQPAGIDCTIIRGTGTGTCSSFFPVGTVVRLDARPADGSSFVGWRSLPGCADASKVTIPRGTTVTCQPGFALK